MSKNNDVVIIELDRPRELRFGHKALKTLVAMTGKDLEQLEEGNIDLGEIEKFLYCGLLSDARTNNETLTLEQMEDLLDEAPSFKHIMDRMTEAFSKSFGELPEGNLPQSVKQPAKPKSGTGTKV